MLALLRGPSVPGEDDAGVYRPLLAPVERDGTSEGVTALLASLVPREEGEADGLLCCRRLELMLSCARCLHPGRKQRATAGPSPVKHCNQRLCRIGMLLGSGWRTGVGGMQQGAATM